RGIGGVPDVLLVVPAQLDLVPVPLGGQQARGGTAHLDHGVVGGGGAVDESFDGGAEGGGGQAEADGQLLDPGQDAGRLIVRRGGGLVQDHPAFGGDADEV